MGPADADGGWARSSDDVGQRRLSEGALLQGDRKKRRGTIEGLAMSLSTPPMVQKLQTALHAKAKQSPSLRFYALYDKVYRTDVLQYAYARCRANGGAAGVDGVTFEQVESEGVESWLGGLAEQFRNKRIVHKQCVG